MNLLDVVACLRRAGCVFAEDEASLLVDAARDGEHLAALVRQRCAGVPLQHLVGWAVFCGRRISVEPGVFVPRQRTEFLARLAARLARPGAIVVDLCCGSGAIGVVVAGANREAEVHACDIDQAAVRCAADNLRSHAAHVHRGDLFDALPRSLRGRVDVVAANAPYVPTDEIRLMPPEAREFEPLAALDGGEDGIGLHRRIAAEAPDWLAPEGVVLVETSQRQAEATACCFSRNGFRTCIAEQPETDATVVAAVRDSDAGVKECVSVSGRRGAR